MSASGVHTKLEDLSVPQLEELRVGIAQLIREAHEDDLTIRTLIEQKLQEQHKRVKVLPFVRKSQAHLGAVEAGG